MAVAGVFNKLRNTLTSTVSEISAALPGNPLLREYDAGSQVGSAGPKFLWKIYAGTKKSTKAEVSIWVLEKKQLDEFNRSDRELILEIFRKGCLQLTKLKHPRILTVEHGMEESRESIVFCTEPVFASVANVLGKINNFAEVPRDLMSYKLHEVEIKYGLMQLSEALTFLHGSVRMVHGNLCPESVIVNKKGSWKLASFDFCVSNTGTVTEPSYSCKDWDTSLPPAALPNPNYLAPEYILRKFCMTSSDLYSLGVLLYSVYYNGKSLFECSVQDVYRQMPRHADELENLQPSKLEKIPSEVRDHQRMLLNPDPSLRPDADQMSKLPFFDHVGVRTLQYLDTLLQRENLQKSQFFKGMNKVLPQLPKRVIMQRVLPSLTSEFSNPDMIPFVLPNVLFIAEDCSSEEFVGSIFPSLIPVFKLQRPIQILLILLQKMDLLLQKTPNDKVQAHILPMLASALDAPSNQIQELCLTIIPNFSTQLEANAMKNSILPRIKKIFLEGPTTAIRIHALVCIGKIIPNFDRWFVQDEVLPALHKITSREPGILMAMLGVYQTALKTDKLGLNKDVMASKSLPFLIPLSIENTLNLKQYTAFMTVIKEMLQRVEKEQSTKLEQLSRMQLEQDAALSFTRSDPATNNSTDTQAQVADIMSTPISQSEPSQNSVAKQQQQLSLEEKQRLARMKQQERQMKSAGNLQPISTSKPPQNKPMNQTKDLTSNLMQRNLNSMSSSTQRTSMPSMMSSQATSQMMTRPQQTRSNGMTPLQPNSNTMTQQSFPGMMTSQPRPGMMTSSKPTLPGQFNTPMMSQYNSMTSASSWKPTSSGSMSMSTYNGMPKPMQPQNNGFMTSQSRPMMSSAPASNQGSSLNNFLNMQQQRPPINQMQSNVMTSQGGFMASPMQPTKPTQNLNNQDLLDFLN
uniref:SCY1-like protein 2 n=1 Tax=Phallusia mammillata TaxID=59560 RepID=A0A6F9DSF7_9ASCI|nr:SCY1-like protein 2 [Phallusia mammillata]